MTKRRADDAARGDDRTRRRGRQPQHGQTKRRDHRRPAPRDGARDSCPKHDDCPAKTSDSPTSERPVRASIPSDMPADEQRQRDAGARRREQPVRPLEVGHRRDGAAQLTLGPMAQPDAAHRANGHAARREQRDDDQRDDERKARAIIRAPTCRAGFQPLEVHALDATPAHALDDDAESARARSIRPTAARGRTARRRVRRPSSRLRRRSRRSRRSASSSSGTRPDTQSASLPSCSIWRLLDVVLVADLADDLLEDVLDRDEAGRAAVLVAHDGDVRAARLEFAQLRVDALRDRNERRRSNRARANRPPALRRRRWPAGRPSRTECR